MVGDSIAIDNEPLVFFSQLLYAFPASVDLPLHAPEKMVQAPQQVGVYCSC